MPLICLASTRDASLIAPLGTLLTEALALPSRIFREHIAVSIAALSATLRLVAVVFSRAVRRGSLTNLPSGNTIAACLCKIAKSSPLGVRHEASKL